MKPSDPIFTHKGWYWFCPIYCAPDDPEFPVESRGEWLEPLFTICGWLDHARIFVSSLLMPDYEPAFMFKVTGPI